MHFCGLVVGLVVGQGLDRVEEVGDAVSVFSGALCPRRHFLHCSAAPLRTGTGARCAGGTELYRPG